MDQWWSGGVQYSSRERYTRFFDGRHAGYMQIDYVFHTCDYSDYSGAKEGY